MHHAIESPYLLQSIVYAGSCYQTFFGSKDSATELLRLHSHHEAVRYLREALQESSGHVSDAMLMSMAILGVHGSTSGSSRKPLTWDPLYRDNDFYSSQLWDQMHVDAVLSLTKQKGGLKSISIADLRDMIFV